MIPFNLPDDGKKFMDFTVVRLDIAEWGARFNASKHARPYRHKSQRALANWRSGNKKKLHKFLNR